MKKILIISFWSTIVLVCFNLFFYLTEIVPPTITHFDDKFGLFPKPDLNFIRIKEGFFIGKSDADGRYGDPYTREKATGKIRIGLIGDSYVKGQDVMPDAHFRKIMEDKLNEGEDGKYEVVNLGRNNFNIPSSYYYYKNFALEFNLDHVLYFMEARDFSGESLNKLITYYSAENGQLIENTDWKESRTYKFLKPLEKNAILRYYSSIPTFNLLNRARMNIRIRGLDRVLFDKFSSWELLLNRKKENFSHQDSDYWSGQTESNLEISEVTKLIISELLKSEHPKITVVTRNYPIKVNKLEDYLIGQNADLIKLSDIFEGTNIRGTDIDANLFKASQLYGGHYNHHGHKALGEFLAEEMKGRLE